jgi:hypothetical protein
MAARASLTREMATPHASMATCHASMATPGVGVVKISPVGTGEMLTVNGILRLP